MPAAFERFTSRTVAARVEVLAVELLKLQVFWEEVLLCYWVRIYCSSFLLVAAWHTLHLLGTARTMTWRHIPEDLIHQTFSLWFESCVLYMQQPQCSEFGRILCLFVMLTVIMDITGIYCQRS